MAVYNKFDCFVADAMNGIHNFSSHDIRIMLSNVQPVRTNTQKSNLTEISPGNGYSAGGIQLTTVTSSQVAGLWKLLADDVIWTASGGTIGPFRYAAMYNNTAANKNLIGWWEYASSQTLNATEQFKVDADATAGYLQYS